MQTSTIKGYYAEDLAIEYLIKRNHRFLQRNYSCIYGEIDIIMTDCNELVFIEVKSSRSFNVSWFENLTNVKFSRIYKTIANYISDMDSDSYDSYRFDVVGVDLITNSVYWEEGIIFE